MLIELTISDFAIIDSLRLALGPHFNVFTGETGAGKSIILDAISALVGERMTADVVRAGSERAIIEGVFDVRSLLARAEAGAPGKAVGPSSRPQEDDVSENGDEPLADILAAGGLTAEDDMLILSREISATGRGVARVNGRMAPLSLLQRIGAQLVDIHGQGAHLALLRPEQHITYLDRYAGLEDQRRQMATLFGEWKATRRDLERLRADEHELERRADLLRYQVDEIAGAHLREGEIEEIERERKRLANAERLGELSALLHSALAGSNEDDADALGAIDLLATAQRALTDLLRLDGTLSEQSDTLGQALALAEDVASVARDYQDEIAADPHRQAELEERWDFLGKLRRKYGATIAEIVAFGEAAARDLEALSNREERLADLHAREEALRQRIGVAAGVLSARRYEAGNRLARAMERELNDLNMQKARFAVQITRRADASGVVVSPHGPGGTSSGGPVAFSASGVDQVSFLIAPNPGEPPKPLARIASGGETSRLMLALKTILADADAVPVLIFDEVDAGVSGLSGQVVGEKLWALARSHQVLCVTHLPQIAVLGDAHFDVAKAQLGPRTVTRVEAISAKRRVEELSNMLGGTRSAAARANAQDLLERATHWKATTGAAPVQA